MRNASVRLIAALVFVSAIPVAATPCPLPTTDVSAAVLRAAGPARLTTTRRTDPDSHEPIIRTIADFADGSTVILEQQNCVIENTRLTLLSPGAEPSEIQVRRAGRILGAVPMWRRHYAGRDAETMLLAETRSPQFRALAKAPGAIYAIDSRFEARKAATEALIGFVQSDSPAVVYKGQLAFYLGIGGH